MSKNELSVTRIREKVAINPKYFILYWLKQIRRLYAGGGQPGRNVCA